MKKISALTLAAVLFFGSLFGGLPFAFPGAACDLPAGNDASLFNAVAKAKKDMAARGVF